MAGEAAARVDLDALDHLRADPRCVRRERALMAKLAAVRASERIRIADAQRRLAGIGCYAGAATGAVDEATRKGVAAYWAVRHGGEPAPLVIDAALSAELAGQTGAVCPPPAQQPVAVAVPEKPQPDTRPAATHAKPQPAAKAEPQVVAEPRRRRPVPVAKAAEPERRRVVKTIEKVVPVVRRPPREIAVHESVPRARPAPAEVAAPSGAPKPHIFY